VQRQHDQGRLTVRERIAALVDPCRLIEDGGLAGRPSSLKMAWKMAC
jgi:acetyl-CoA carboxylase carboxyltransferase component